jgi:predicted transcriptional regulator
MIGADQGENSMDILKRGGIPDLNAINIHNGTIYKWNRLCYGVGGGIPHIRIENRYIPSGPTPIDEMANTVFWIGLMLGMPDELKGIFPSLPYQDVRNNFLKAARHGLEVEFNWLGKSIGAADLIIDKLLPMAENGLKKKGLTDEEIKKYLGVIHDRVSQRRTGAKWITNSLRKLNRKHSKDECMLLLTQEMYENNKKDIPGHEWELASDKSLHAIPNKYNKVSQVMKTDTLSVLDSDVLYFAFNVMDWNNTEYIPVEAEGEMVVGLISIAAILVAKETRFDWKSLLVKDFMMSDIITLGPEMSIEKAKDVLKINKLSCIPVVSDNLLVGVIRDSDIRNLKS